VDLKKEDFIGSPDLEYFTSASQIHFTVLFIFSWFVFISSAISIYNDPVVGAGHIGHGGLQASG